MVGTCFNLAQIIWGVLFGKNCSLYSEMHMERVSQDYFLLCGNICTILSHMSWLKTFFFFNVIVSVGQISGCGVPGSTPLWSHWAPMTTLVRAAVPPEGQLRVYFQAHVDVSRKLKPQIIPCGQGLRCLSRLKRRVR